MFIKKMKARKLNDHSQEIEDEEDDYEGEPAPGGAIILSNRQESRTIGLFGEVEEQKVAQIIGIMIDLAEMPSLKPVEPSVSNSEASSQTTSEEVKSQPETAPQMQKWVEPIDFIISTPGGSADDMFALYDIMRTVKEKCDIVTFGIGKVMSAGVLLLASGTKGKRKIGKNCRVMIHSIIGGTSGSFHNLENEMEEMKYIQQSYLSALCAESNMTERQLKKMLNRKVNIYLSAEEAVKLGIADIIV